ncbi:thioredoxin family protein [Falsibacillus albus]|uniref:Thioredoxin n=1 Tax=Falsibacillus albus TaxID=2478915 RepID=A0A3L7K6G8_9BACI|nr:thioredoxin family protein [Falsibacillus albus]RLQ97899.1 thioredoxin [Falsibacillus albus]
MESLNSIDQFNEMKNNGKHIFMFSADWCPDCRFVDPFMPELESEFNDYTFVYVDRDQFIDLCAELSIFGIPSFVATKDGAELGRFVSKDRKTMEEIQQFIKKL